MRAGAIALALAGCAAHPGATLPDAPGATPDARAPDATPLRTYDLRFVPGSAYSLYASIGGGPAHRVQLDTGSLGLFVPKSVLGPDAQVSTDPCSITYVSSGNVLAGHYATAQVALLGSTAQGDVTPAPTTAPMTFCAVEDPAGWTGGMMGVGFGRGAAPDPARNVLLQLADIKSGAMHAGFVLSTHPAPHVQLGLADGDAARFATIALAPHPDGTGDWLASSLRGCLAIPSAPGFGAPCGPLLVDTGVADCLLWDPPDPTLGGVVPSGQTSAPAGVAMTITSGGALDYAFTTGAADAPAAVTVRTASAFSINTGRALLVDFDYLFDAQEGLVGFRRAP